jgi:molybdate transport system substrate-binding protein
MKKYFKYFTCLLSAVALSLAFSACGPKEQSSGSSEASSKLTIFAAASTTNAVQEIAELYQETSGVSVVSSFASSSTLAKQIAQGAPAEFFISANPKWMSFLEEADAVLAGTRIDLLGNRLVLIAPVDSAIETIEIDDKLDLLAYLPSGARIAMGDPAHVPAGIYGQSALQHLGLWSSVKMRVAPMNDVRAALSIVERGEAPLGIVYATDAALSERVKVVGVFPEGSHPAIVYPFAVVADEMSELARSFYDFLQGPEAASIFEKYGFAVLQ